MKKRQKIWTRLLSIILCFLLIISVLPVDMMAAEINTTNQSVVEQTKKEAEEGEVSEQEVNDTKISEQKEVPSEQENERQDEENTTVVTEETSTQAENLENTSEEEETMLESNEVVKSTEQGAELTEVQEENGSTEVNSLEQNIQEETTEVGEEIAVESQENNVATEMGEQGNESIDLSIDSDMIASKSIQDPVIEMKDLVSSNDKQRYVVLVLDTSSSSEFKKNGKLIYTADTAIEDVKASAKKFLSDILKADGINQIAIVSYKSTATVVSDFTTDIGELNDKIDKLYASENIRDISAGIESASKLLSKVDNENAIKNVVLFTTGMTNAGSYSYSGHYDENTVGNTWYRQDTGVKLYAYANVAYNTIENLKTSGVNVYTLGLFQTMQNMPEAGKNIVNFFKLTAREFATSDDYFYEVTDVNKLEFVFGEIADDIIKEQKDYIQAHLDFIANNDIWYSESKNSAKKFLEGDSDFKYLPPNEDLEIDWLLVTNNLSDNPYNIILSDLVLSEENVDLLYKTYDVEWISKSKTILDDFMTFLKKHEINLDGKVQDELDKLIRYNNISDSGAYKFFDKILGNKLTEEQLETFAQTYVDIGIIKKFFDRGDSIGESTFKIINHIITAEAFKKTSDEFDDMLLYIYYLNAGDELPYNGNKLLAAAILEFFDIQYENIDDKVSDMIIKESAKQAIGIGKDFFGSALEVRIRNYLFKSMDMSTAMASKVTAFIEGCKIGYAIGTEFCNSFLNITNISQASLYARCSCEFTNELREVSEAFGKDLEQKKDLSSAKRFCEAYSSYRKMQFKSIEALIKYRDAVQDAAWSQITDGLIGRKKEFAIISVIAAENVNWYDKSCHEEGKFENVINNDRFLVVIQCPVDVAISDKQGNIIAEIVDNEVSYVQYGVTAFDVNSHKYILLPDKDYIVKIEATDNGTMHYGVYRCQQDGSFIEGAIFENIVLKKGKVFNGNLPINAEPPVEKFALMTDNKIAESDATDLKDVEDTPITALMKTQIISCNSSDKGMELTWNKVDEAEGYQVQYATNKNFTSATSLSVKGASTVSRIISGLTVNKKYYVRVRAYKTVNNKKYYAKWSDTKTITIKEVEKPVSTKVKNFVKKYVSSSGKTYTEANIGNYVQILKGISIWNDFDSTEQKQANKLISSEGKVNYKSLYNAAEKIRKQCISDDGGNLASIPMTATGKSTSTQLTWSSVKGADGYYVYANRCNKGDKKYKWKCVKTIKSGSTVAYTHKNLLKNTAYKYRIGAYAMIDGKKVLIARSLILHSYTTASSPKYKNPSKVTVSNDKVALKVGKTKKITAKISSYTKGKKISNHVVKIRYIISDPAVASISLSGTIKAKKAGSCTIWACAQNGVRKAIKVTVTK